MKIESRSYELSLGRDLSINIDVEYKSAMNGVTAHAQRIDIPSFGKDIEEAEDRILEAIELELRCLNDEGKLQSALSYYGINVYGPIKEQSSISLSASKTKKLTKMLLVPA